VRRADLLDITFKQLQAFVTIAEARTFTAAADRLGISQATISRHIRSIEAKCGPLFTRRSGGRVLLSPTGLVVHRRAVNILDEIVRIGVDIDDSSTSVATLRVSSSECLYERMRHVAAEFMAVHLDKMIYTSVSTSEEESLRRIQRDEIDILYVTKSGEDPLNSYVCFDDIRVGLYAAPTGIDWIERLQTGTIDLIMPNSGASEERFIMDILMRAGIERYAIVARAPDLITIRSLCLRGIGAAVLYDDIAEQEVRAGRLVRIAAPLASMKRCYSVNRSADSSLAMLFHEFASDALRNVEFG